jgi:hypothetical protein
LLAGAPPLPEPRRRVVCRLRRVPAASAALDEFAVSRAASRCLPRTEPSPGALDRVRRRAPPPLAAGRRRRSSPAVSQPLARVLHRRIKIRRIGSARRPLLTRARPQPLDLDPMDLDQAGRVNTGQPGVFP